MDTLKPVMTGEDLHRLQLQVREVAVENSISEYLIDIVTATRNHDMLELGVSTRGALTLYRAVQSLAFIKGRDYAVPDDVKDLAVPVLAHRVICGGLVHEGQRTKAQQVIRQILQETPVP